MSSDKPEQEATTYMRRADDRDRQLNDRLERLERQQEQTRSAVGALENTVNTVKIEQAHMREIVDVRLRMIEESSKLHSSKLDELKTLIAEMAADPRKSPAGNQVSARIDEVVKSAEKTDEELALLVAWRAKAEGAISLLNWLGAAGLIGFALTMLRVLKLLP